MTNLPKLPDPKTWPPRIWRQLSATGWLVAMTDKEYFRFRYAAYNPEWIEVVWGAK